MNVPTQRILVVGVGSIGERHARCFSQIEGVSVGVVEPHESRRTTVAQRLGLSIAYATLAEALHAGTWCTVVICTPAPTHIDLALHCLDHGLPTLIEKPLAVTVDQAASLLKRQRDGAPPIGVAYVYRAHPALAAMKSAVREDRFGRPLQIVATFGQHFPTHRPAYASTYYTRHDTGGGAIQDALTHVFNTAEWLVGPITRLAVDAQHLALANVAVEDTVHVMARHDRVMASYSLNQHQAPDEAVFTLVCERGTMRAELHRNRWRWQSDATGSWADVATPLASRDDWFERQARSWMKVVADEAAPLCTLAEAFQTLAANETALTSARRGSVWLDVKPSDVAIREVATEASA